AHEAAEPMQLHRLPDDEARGDQDAQGDDEREVRSALRGVVDRQILVRELAAERIGDVAEYRARRDRQQPAAKMTGDDAVSDIHEAVRGEEPHRGEMPL